MLIDLLMEGSEGFSSFPFLLREKEVGHILTGFTILKSRATDAIWHVMLDYFEMKYILLLLYHWYMEVS